MDGLCAALPQLRNLKKLRLRPLLTGRGDALTPALLRCLLGAPVDTLDLSYAAVLSDAVQSDTLSQFSRLTTVVNRSSAAYPEPLTSFRPLLGVAGQVRVLDLSYCNEVTEDGAVRFLLEARRLTELRLTSCRLLGDATMCEAVELPHLEVMCVNGTGVTLACKRPLEMGECRRALVTLWLPLTWDPTAPQCGRKKAPALLLAAFTRKEFAVAYDPWF
jgi:hypothetical protein